MLWVIRNVFRIVGNFYWKIFGGFFLSLLWYAVGTVLLFSVVGFPLSVECFRIGWLNYKPFGKSVALIFDRPIISLLWLITFGWVIGVISLVNAIFSCLTVVGLPLVGQWVKVCRLAFFPFCSVWK
ncbi:MAG: hypothetical protein K2G37_06335 [Clostridia bacterium]|nr:hypothetical protein [Clostridia bacterium]MDE7329284.1 hypothetical protein [Clostridia bacterium]